MHAGGGDKQSVRRLVDSILAFGTEGYPPTVARRLMLLNAMNLAAIFFDLSWAVAFLMLDARALWPAVVAFVGVAICYLLTPFLHRISDTAAAFYFIGLTVVAFVLNGHLLGSSAGSQYFLLSAPAVMLFVGLERKYAIATLIALMGLAFCYVEFFAPTASPLPPEALAINKTACIAGALLMASGAVYYGLALARNAEAALEREYARSETLLLNLMPNSIARRLKDDPHRIIADQFDEVTILFADIVDFTPRASQLAPEETVKS